MAINVDYVIGKTESSIEKKIIIPDVNKTGKFDISGRPIIKKSIGEIEGILVELVFHKSGMWIVGLFNINLLRYDCEVFVTKYYANKYYKRLKRKYKLKEE